MIDDADLWLVGYLVTDGAGRHARLGPDKAAADQYVVQHRAELCEPMYVIRPSSPRVPAVLRSPFLRSV